MTSIARTVALIVAAFTLVLGTLASPAAPATSTPPDILLIVTDDQTYEALSKMPYVDGRPDWVRFTRAFVNNSECCPSRATILSGQYSHHTGVETNAEGPNFDDRDTIATWLDPTYHTAFFGKYLNNWPTAWRLPSTAIPPGWDRWAGFVRKPGYYNYTLNRNGTLHDFGSGPNAYSTDVLTKETVNFLDTTTEPFLAVYATRAPHGPFTAAPRHLGFYDDLPVPHDPNFNESNAGKPAWWQALDPRDPDHMDRSTHRAWNSLLAVDQGVHQMFSVLAQRNMLNHTVVIFISDNAVARGAHRWNAKGCAYEECVHVPLLISMPGATPRESGALVSNVDLAPTIADLAGVTPTIPEDGKTLVPVLKGTASDLDRPILIRCVPHNPVTNPPRCWAIRTYRWKYIETVGTGERELYDLRADPYELDNLDGQSAHARIEADLARRLDKLRGP